MQPRTLANMSSVDARDGLELRDHLTLDFTGQLPQELNLKIVSRCERYVGNRDQSFGSRPPSPLPRKNPRKLADSKELGQGNHLALDCISQHLREPDPENNRRK